MHIADFSPSSSSFVEMLALVAVECRKRGMDTLFVLPTGASKRDWVSRLSEVAQVRFIDKSGNKLRLALAVLRLYREWKPALVHSHFSTFDIPSLVASTWLLPVRRPGVLWHVHSPRGPREGSLHKLLWATKWALLARRANVVHVSGGGAKQMEQLGQRAGSSTVILNAADFGSSLRQTRSREEVRRGWGIGPREMVLLMFGRDPQVKGVDWALDAFQRLHAAFPACRLVIVAGADPQAVNALVNQQASRIGGVVVVPPTTTPGDYYAAADLFLAPSRREGLPLSVVEALAASLPVVATDIPGMQWAASLPAVTLVPPGDAQAMANALAATLSWSPEERSRRTAPSREHVMQQHDPNLWAATIADHYLRLLGR